MPTLRQESLRKSELLEAYREQKRREIHAELGAEAEAQAAEGRFPWKGEFRSQAEIFELYSLRRKWDRRFMFDLAVVVVFCFGLVAVGSRVVKVFAPEPNSLESGAQR
ncbi:MAG TPA: hypothetical protein VGC54_07455 [Planctomycetota bacterium]